MAGPTKKDLLSTPDKGISKAHGLAILWRKILNAVGVRPDMWGNHMNHYLSDPTNKIGNDAKTRSTAKGNLEKRLFGDEPLTWSQFLKGIKVLSYSFKRVRISIFIETNRGEEIQVDHDLIKPREEQKIRRRKHL